MEIERQSSSNVMGDHRRVHMHGSLRSAGCSTGEVKEGHILRSRAPNVKVLEGPVHQHCKAMDALGLCGFAVDET